ncbi:hypothetical protein RFI_08794 [Reticulomyxa filosa]|uniref:Uncharacterized protein n=1 Tax=Reticulomyxa filosa TaxID=46433 RepID=X6NQY8_RETFI|nr:hypothetical protein RFI_08794 [Reticulomyxa filosa]|eukprot:ETO28333.1 hypothetical protein RFI_08794 [Reticulomyxa filosa]
MIEQIELLHEQKTLLKEELKKKNTFFVRFTVVLLYAKNKQNIQHLLQVFTSVLNFLSKFGRLTFFMIYVIIKSNLFKQKIERVVNQVDRLHKEKPNKKIQTFAVLSKNVCFIKKKQILP